MPKQEEQNHSIFELANEILEGFENNIGLQLFYAKQLKATLPTGMDQIRNLRGKAARDTAKKLNELSPYFLRESLGNLGQIRQTKRLQQYIKEFSHLEKKLHSLEKIESAIAILGPVLTAANNISELSWERGHSGAVLAEVGIRTTEYFGDAYLATVMAEASAAFLGQVGLALGPAAVPWLAVPAVFILHQAGDHFYFEPLKEEFEHLVKPILQSGGQSALDYFVFPLLDEAANILRPAVRDLQKLVQYFSPANRQSPVSTLSSLGVAEKIKPKTEILLPTSNGPIPIESSAIVQSNTELTAPKTQGKWLLVFNPGEAGSQSYGRMVYVPESHPFKARLDINQSQSGRMQAEFSISGLINHGTRVDFSGQILGLDGKEKGLGLGLQLERQVEASQLNLGWGLHANMTKRGMQAALSGTIASTDSKLGGSIAVGSAGIVGGALSFSTTNPIGMAVGACALIGYGAYLFVDDILSRQKQQAAAQYQQDLYKASAQLKQVMERQDIKLARKLCQDNIRRFPNESAFQQCKQALYDPKLLLSVSCIILEHEGLEKAQRFFNEAIRQPSIHQRQQQECAALFAVKQYQCGYWQAAQKTADSVLDSFAVKKTLSDQERNTQDELSSLVVKAELRKPFETQSTQYLLAKTARVSEAVQEDLISSIVQHYDEREQQINKLWLDTHQPTQLSKEEKIAEQKKLESHLNAIRSKAYEFVYKQYQHAPASVALLLKTLELATVLHAYSDVQNILVTETAKFVADSAKQQFNPEQNARMAILSNAAFCLGLNKDAGKEKEAFETILALLSLDSMSTKDKAKSHFYLAELLSRHPKLSSESDFAHYRSGYELDPANPAIASAMAEEYCKRLEFDKAQETLRTTAELNPENKTILEKIDLISLRSIRMQQFSLMMASTLGRTLIRKYQQVFQIDEDSAILHRLYQVEGLITGGAHLYLRRQATQVSQKLSKKPHSKTARYKKVQAGVQMLLSSLSLALEQLSRLDEKERAKLQDLANQFQNLNSAVNIVSWIVTELPNRDLSIWNKTSSAALSILVPLANYFHQGHFRSLRGSGQAPMELAGILGEETCAFLSNKWVNLGINVYQYSDEIYNLMQYISAHTPLDLAGYTSAGAEQLVQLASQAWSGIGIYGQAAVVGVGAAVVIVASYKYYEHCWYRNRIDNIHHFFMTAKDKPQNPEDFAKIQTILDEVKEAWPTDKEMLRLSDMKQVYQALNQKETQNIEDALQICQRRIEFDLKNPDFRDAKMRLLIHQLSNHDLTEEARAQKFAQAEHSLEDWQQQNPKSQEARLWKLMMAEAKCHYIEVLQLLDQYLVEAKDNKTRDSIQARKKETLQKMQNLVESITSSNQAELSRWKKTLTAKAGDFLEFKGSKKDRTIWRENQAFSAEDGTKIEKSQKAPGDLVENKDGIFIIAENGLLRNLEQETSQLLQASKLLTEHFSKSKLDTWILSIKAQLDLGAFGFFEPQRDAWRARIQSEEAYWLESLRESYSSLEENQQRLGACFTELEVKLIEFCEKTQEKQRQDIQALTTTIDAEQQHTVLNKLTEALSSYQQFVFSKLNNLKAKLLTIPKSEQQQADFKILLQESVAELENELETQLQKSHQALWTKALLDLGIGIQQIVFTIFSDRFSNWQTSKRSNDVPLPDWSYEPVRGSSAKIGFFEKTKTSSGLDDLQPIKNNHPWQRSSKKTKTFFAPQPTKPQLFQKPKSASFKF